MAKQTFSTHGITYEFEDNSGEILAALENALERGLEAIGMTAEGYAKDLCPVDTGRLRNSIGHKVDGEDVYIGTNVEYAPYIELGTGIYNPQGRKTPWWYQDEKGNWHWTRGARAQPFLKPAAANHAQEYRKILKDSMENA